MTTDTSTLEFTTSDGVVLSGDLTIPSGALAATIICHPHPQYGGNRFNPVVEAVHRALPDARIASFRFDFRGAFANGVGERLDARSALDSVRTRVPDVPLFVVGYSFGAMVALSMTDGDVRGKVLVAPPLGTIEAIPGAVVPTLVLTPGHDQFAAPAVSRPIVETWPDTALEVIESADHFLAGHTDVVARRTTDWILEHIARA